MMLEAPNTNQIKGHNVCPRACRALWCAVIEEQLRLALKHNPTLLGPKIDTRRALAWFGSRDFFEVCAIAGFDGGWVLAGVRSRLAEVGLA
ncbi:hypothetical protein HKX54_02270 [Sulfitobacter sp. M57]|uniref:hypothetical protein n=1 Tax=unclassified Sulfitobacter TaxID=196795 RepID=UPI0023E0BF8F|nr:MULTISPECIES: hypothetical protein [unclassified Sulfitobacter]MDF3413267.1 hypothetical protein [Sulfitobacter sp. KE5]MDF3421452.1 hypothetical protein [Sulfitobacter sp. KE43]MDF3431814.1 hypothetical protein [Sulfitobacter sp. KE42]MDF3457454.1 hypothetical protein [Sulfitobacter sp. S74]MDF3461357.1 hypothetical protein [Sulfitobacter sp. Ks18]